MDDIKSEERVRQIKFLLALKDVLIEWEMDITLPDGRVSLIETRENREIKISLGVLIDKLIEIC